MKPLSFSIPVIVGSILSLFLHVYLGYQGWKTGNCGDENSLIIYRFMTDYEIGCEGIDRAKNFFTDHGLSFDAPITIFFEHKLSVDSELYDTDRVLGYFSPFSNYIQVLSYRYHPLIKGKAHLLNLELNNHSEFEELLTSIITHEVTHLLALYNYEEQGNIQFKSAPKPMMGHGVQEYIAGVVQIDSMEKSIRGEVLDQYVRSLTFTYEQEINQLSYSAEPQEFWIKSYRHFHSKDTDDQKLLLERIFSGELNPDSVLNNVMFALQK